MDILIPIAASFAAGLLSFLSPCVFPLVPSYLAMMAGASVKDLGSGEDGGLRKRTLARSAVFSLGFSAVFILLGLVFSQAGSMIGGGLRYWSIVAGVVVIFLGINTAFDLLTVLNFEKRFHFVRRPSGYLSLFLFGAAFGAGWSPCVGPILASILFLAGSGSLPRAAAQLAVYSLGLALPFMAAGLFFGKFKGLMETLKRHMSLVKKVSGLLLVSIGLYMILGDLRNLSGNLVRLGYGLEDFIANHGTASRIGTSGLYILLAMAAVASTLLRKRAGKKAGPSAILGVLFTLLFILEATGYLSTLSFLASWLLFTGI